MYRRRRMVMVTIAAAIIYLLYQVAHYPFDDPSRYKPVANLRPHPEPQAVPQAAPQAVPQAAAPPSNDQGRHRQHDEISQSTKDGPEDPVKEAKAPKHTDIAESVVKKTQDDNLDSDSDSTLADIYPKNPPKVSLETPKDKVVPKAHWKPYTENFPVAADSMKLIPSRKPSDLPAIQYKFDHESSKDKNKRIQRQARVGKEIERAWAGYKKHALTHDELSPVSGKFRDPFCGWGATLIDSLSTLWIAGLREEFDEAIKLVKNIDFTTSECTSIPVFETTIRYLGGLISAFDLSSGPEGGSPFLLDKAVELADVLMGAFDTPNRMPVLYYQWKPDYASQPHRAGTVGLAELATLSLEFSRLTQLTKKPKYYDAVDRITDALYKMQKAGTAIPGLFPESLDASGCNRTAMDQQSSLSKAAQEQLNSQELSKKPNGYVIDKIQQEKAEDESAQAPPSKQDQSAGFVVGKIQKEMESNDAAPRPGSGNPLKDSTGFVVGKILTENEGGNGNSPHQLTSNEKGGFVVGKIQPEIEGIDDYKLQPHVPKEKGSFVVGKIQPENEGSDIKGPHPSTSNGKQDGFVVGKIQPENQDDDNRGHQADSRQKVGEFIVGKIQPESPDSTDQLPKKSDGFVVGKVKTEEVSGSNAAAIRRRDDIPIKDETPGAHQIPERKIPAGRERGQQPPFAADGSSAEWECVPQGLTPGRFGPQVYHVAGGQDSAYEYFLKTYLFLGGSEPKYQKLWSDAAEAISEWLLYRPMIKDDRDILFPARVLTHGDPNKDLTATFEISHLACFLGGTYAMSGKLMKRKEDIEIGSKLTDGCVWAYEVMPSGIMPETAQIVPCPTMDKCVFNETLWHEKLDNAGQWRDKKAAEWEEEVARRGLERLKQQQQGAGGNDGIHQVKDSVAESLRQAAADREAFSDAKSHQKRAAVPVRGGKKDTVANDPNAGSELPQALKDRIGWKTDDKMEEKKEDSPLPKLDSQKGDESSEKKPGSLNSVLEKNRLPPLPPKAAFPPKPLSHQEFVKEKIERFRLPPGFTAINNPSYFLRPEAIESVFYMYRITGDPIWMDKGWKMFEATIRATRTEIANSAIDNVTKDEPELKDEMESFWLGETLKYYYLLFSDPSLISLDDWVFNTEAHPLRRMS